MIVLCNAINIVSCADRPKYWMVMTGVSDPLVTVIRWPAATERDRTLHGNCRNLTSCKNMTPWKSGLGWICSEGMTLKTGCRSRDIHERVF